MDKIRLLHPVWAEINVDNFIYNINIIKQNIPNNVMLLAVVKANAYGHGAVSLGKIACDNGVDMLAVSSIKEALTLRNNLDNDINILVLGYTDVNLAELSIMNNITLCIYNKQLAIVLSKIAVKHKKLAKIHIKLDTGMGRIGYQCIDRNLSEIAYIYKLPNIVIEGVFTHFSASDEDSNYTFKQMRCYINFIDKMKTIGINPSIFHCANSASLMLYPDTHMNMVRAGIILYGLKPSSNINMNNFNVKPVMSLKTKIIHIKDINKGDSVSYGRKFIAHSKMRIATLPIGYADGYMRSLSNKAEVLVNGNRASVIGSICMDQCMIDISNIKDVNIGDEVILFGIDKNHNEISVDELAKIIGTINYELITTISNRVSRVLLYNNKYTIDTSP